ncbi:MAG: hypothetical protein CM1200mP9_08550 [Gammaproteobacteria bacterium]|nr:MAG: hypothetical protein CM1200mP9_08550 [Gammaproteobacteria bacterium]
MTVKLASITRSWPFTTNKGTRAYSISTIEFTAENPPRIGMCTQSTRTAFGITQSPRRCRSDASEESANRSFIAQQSFSTIKGPRVSDVMLSPAKILHLRKAFLPRHDDQALQLETFRHPGGFHRLHLCQ